MELKSRVPADAAIAARCSGWLRLGAATLITTLITATGTALGGGEPPKPTIAGEARVGETLTAGVTSGPDPDLYRWQRCNPVPGPCDAGADHEATEWTGILEGPTATSYTLVDADLGQMIRLVAKFTSNGTKWSSSEAIGPVEPAFVEPLPDDPEPEPEPEPEPTPKPQPEGSGDPASPPPATVSDPNAGQPRQRSNEPLPPPTAHETANAEPVKGTVLVKEPGGRFRELTDPEQVVLGAIFDTTAGRVSIVTARDKKGRVQGVEFWAGRFVLDQTGGKAPITEAKLTRRSGAAGSGPQRRAARRGKKRNRLWGSGKCRCRTRGKRGSGTVRGTKWLTHERRRGTRFKVKEGRVKVRDFTRKRSVVLRAGESYLAKKKRR